MIRRLGIPLLALLLLAALWALAQRVEPPLADRDLAPLLCQEADFDSVYSSSVVTTDLPPDFIQAPGELRNYAQVDFIDTALSYCQLSCRLLIYSDPASARKLLEQNCAIPAPGLSYREPAPGDPPPGEASCAFEGENVTTWWFQRGEALATVLQDCGGDDVPAVAAIMDSRLQEVVVAAPVSPIQSTINRWRRILGFD